jgi:hypothetical protein
MITTAKHPVMAGKSRETFMETQKCPASSSLGGRSSDGTDRGDHLSIREGVLD